MTGNTSALRGLYAITDSTLCAGPGLQPAVAAALEGGARLVQYRDKSGQQARRRQEAHALAALCRKAGAVFIVNDDVDLAAEVEADGVHLGRDDTSLAAARSHLGRRVIIGVSCYHELARARAAADSGADYVAFGRFFHSSTKPGQPLADLELLAHARDELDVPIAVIGGITSDNAAPLIDSGADMLACIHSVFGQPDVRRAAARLSALCGSSTL